VKKWHNGHRNKWHYITGKGGTVSPDLVAQWRPDYPVIRLPNGIEITLPAE